jgi:hypothetical protein
MLVKSSSNPIEIFTKENKSDLSHRMKLTDQDINQYYRPMIQLCMAYNESLYYFARADFHQNKFSRLLNRVDVLNKLISIYKFHLDKSVILKVIGKNDSFIKNLSAHGFDHKELVKSLGAEKVAFKFYYAEYVKLQESLDKIYDKHHLNDILQKLNSQLVLECSSKNLKDRSDYYLTFDDMQIYDYLVAPIVGFHAILIAFIFPPAAASALGVLTGTAMSAGIEIGKTQVINLLKRTYNVIIRDNKFYHIDNIKLDEKIEEAHQKFDLYEIKNLILKLKQSSTRTGDFNYFLANTFKYYAKLKGECNNLSRDYLAGKKIFESLISEEGYLENQKKELDDSKTYLERKKTCLKLEREYLEREKKYLAKRKEYDTIIFDKKYLYYKTMSYFRCKNILEETLRIQIDSIKLITSQSLLMLRGNEEFCQFLDGYKKSHSDLYIRTKVRSLILKLGGKSNIDDFENLVMMGLNNKKFNILDEKYAHITTLNPHSSIKDDILKFSDNFGGTADFVNQVTKILSNIPGTDTYFSELTKHSKEFDLGLWLSLNALDGILYLSNTSSAIQKYQKISSYIKKISSFITLGNYALGVVNLVGQSWIHLFSSPFITNFSLNPFSIFTSFLNVNISKSVSSNYSAIWKDICNHFEDYKNNYHSVPKTPAYDYFVLYRKMDPGEAMHKISDIFKNNFASIINVTENINDNSIKLIEKIKKYNNKTSGSSHPEVLLGINAFYAARNVSHPVDTTYMEDEILTDYIKIFLSLFSQAKELESYSHYLNFLKDFDLEINDFLKLHFVMLGVEDKGVFSVINFGTNPDVNRMIFSHE